MREKCTKFTGLGWRLLVLLFIGGMGLGATLGMRSIVVQQEITRLQMEFEDSVKDHKQALTQAFELKLAVLNSVRSLYDVGGEISRQAFHDFVKPFLSGLPSIQAIEWIPRIPHFERKLREEAAVADGLKDFHITGMDANGRVHADAERDEYFPVYFVEPLAGNETAVGFDLGSHPARLAALTRSFTSGQAVASEGIRLVQEKQGQLGMLIFLPVYKSGMAPSDTLLRHEALRGFVLGVFRIGDLTEHAFSRLHCGDLLMSIRDCGREGGGGSLLYMFGEKGQWDGCGTPPSVAGVHPRTELLYVCGRTWQLTFAPTAAFLARRSWTGEGILVGGILLTIAISGSFIILTGQKQRLETRVVERTVALEQSRTELKVQAEEQALLLDNIETQIWHLIEPGVYGVVNKAHADFIGKPQSAFQGTPLHELLRPEEAEVCIAGNLRVFRDKTAIRTEEWLVGARGESRLLKITKTPKFRSDGEVAFIVCSGEDITEARQLQEKLARSRARFRAVVEDQTELICRFTPDCVLTFVNQTYARYWNKTPGELIGTNWLLLLPEGARQGARDHLKALTQANPVSMNEHEVLTAEGKIRWQQWADRVLFDEHGNIVEYQSIGRDITDRKNAEQQLAREKNLLQSLMNSIPDLFFYKDMEGRYLGCNAALEHLTGRKEQEIVGLTDMDLFPPEIANSYRLNDLLMLNTGMPRSNEEWVTYPDGRRALVETIKTPHCDSDGKTLGLIGISRDITRLREAERASMEAHRKLLDVREEEYRRIAEELHEVVCQDIVALRIALKQLVHELAGKGIGAMRESLESAAETCKQIVAETRQICYSLYPSALDKLGLVAALHGLEKTGENAGVKVHVHALADDLRLPRTMEIAFYRVAQEAVVNAIRHGAPTLISVILEHRDEGLTLRITDNGRGFTPTPESPGLGLTIMQERMHSVGGTVKITSAPGNTIVLAVAPTGRGRS